MYNIAVIGCGVVGMTSALQLQKDLKNAKITIFTADITPNTTGDLSAGFWTPYLLQGTPEDDIMRWAKETHDYFLKLWKEGLCEEAGVSLIPVLRLFTEDVKIPKWTKIPFGSHMLPREKLNILSKQYGRNYTAANHYVTFTCEPTKFLPYLMQEFLKNGGNIIRRKINSFSELSDYEIIVNCTGLQARELTPDNKIHPVRGQISRVKAPWVFQVISEEIDDGIYIIPNIEYVILGGTHQENDENLNVCPNDKDRILKGCIKVCPGLQTCKEHLDGVGLRPGRSKVRIDSESLQLGPRTIHIVHNYGHGGAGVTLCVGCAKDVSLLVKKSLNLLHLNSHL